MQIINNCKLTSKHLDSGSQVRIAQSVVDCSNLPVIPSDILVHHISTHNITLAQRICFTTSDTYALRNNEKVEKPEEDAKMWCKKVYLRRQDEAFVAQ